MYFSGSSRLIVCSGMPAYIANRPISYLGSLIIGTDYKRPDNNCCRVIEGQRGEKIWVEPHALSIDYPASDFLTSYDCAVDK